MKAEIYHIHDLSQLFLNPEKPTHADDYTFVYRYVMSDETEKELNAAMNGLDDVIGINTDGIPNLCIKILNQIYQDLNINHPKDYKVRSLSVGDIIIMTDIAFRVEMMGFSVLKLPDDFREACSRRALEGVKL